jgi:hypothetical protein
MDVGEIRTSVGEHAVGVRVALGGVGWERRRMALRGSHLVRCDGPPARGLLSGYFAARWVKRRCVALQSSA